MKLNIGDKVIIHYYISDKCKDEDENLRIGTVIGISKSDNLSYHGSSSFVDIYTVKGKDGREYRGTYGEDYIHYGYTEKTYFMTAEDQEKEWEKRIMNLEENVNRHKNHIQEFKSKIRKFCCNDEM